MNKKKLNIAVVVGVFPTVSETFILNQIVYLIRCGHSVTILSYRKGLPELLHDDIIEYKLSEKCIYFEKPDKGLRRLLQFFVFVTKSFRQINWLILFRSLNIFKHRKEALNLSLFFQAQWFIKQCNFDLLHVHFAYFATDFANLFEKKIVDKIPFVVSYHGHDIAPHRFEEFKISYVQLFKWADIFTVNSIYTKSLLDKIYSGNNVCVLPESLDTNKFLKNEKVSSDKGNRFDIIFCGRLIKWKAPDIAIEMVENLVRKRNRTNIYLRIIGDGAFKQELQHKINNAQLQQYVILLGALSQEDIKKEMSNADMFLFPGIHEPETGRAENQGLVIQEAQSMQLPVVVSDAGGMKYGLKENITGFVVKEKDVEGFADKVELLIQSEDKKNEMGIEGRKFVVENFDINVLGSKLIEIYEQAIADNRGARMLKN